MSTHPTPDLTVHLEDGGELEIYDLDTKVLVMGTGHATGSTVTPGLRQLVRSNHLVELYEQLRPHEPVPTKLRDIQSRFALAAEHRPATRAGDTPRARESTTQSGAGVAGAEGVLTPPPLGSRKSNGSGRGQSGGEPSGVSASSWCGNGCCDVNWMWQNLCWPGGDAVWFLYDYGWSYAYYLDTWHYYGAACAIYDWSVLNIWREDGFHGSWWVPQGNYRWWDWLVGVWETEKDVWGQVNYADAQASHTFCGSASW